MNVIAEYIYNKSSESHGSTIITFHLNTMQRFHFFSFSYKLRELEFSRSFFGTYSNDPGINLIYDTIQDLNILGEWYYCGREILYSSITHALFAWCI